MDTNNTSGDPKSQGDEQPASSIFGMFDSYDEKPEAKDDSANAAELPVADPQ